MRLSVTRVLCDETKEFTANVFYAERCNSRKSTTVRAFQRAIDEVHMLPLTPPKGGSKGEFVV